MSTLQRWQFSTIQNALKTRRVAVIAGARQCGKTTLSKLFAEKMSSDYRTLDDKLLLQAAHADPQEFVRHQQHPLMIIDEIQKAPMLLPAIKKCVDEDTRNGQYLLTGSANIQSLPGVSESLAGRIRKIALRPFSQGEINHHQPHFLEDAFDQKFNTKKIDVLSRDNIFEIALRGGYPETLSLPYADRQLWHRNYMDALLERDLKDIINIRRHDVMANLMQVVSAWSTKPINMAAIGSGLSVQRHTLESYFNALSALFIIDRIPAITKTDYEYIEKQPKLIMNDSGLMASLLRLQFDDIRFDADRAGKIIETHVGNELQKHIDAHEPRYALYHFRDRNKREIDFIIERDDHHVLGVEVKASTSADAADFKHLKWYKENLMQKRKEFIGIVLYTGNHVASFGEGLWAVPIAALY